MNERRILIAGVGNIFFGDDGFGSVVAERLSARALPEGVRVIDFGIRAVDLMYALLDGYDTVILVDAARRGQPPGTVYVIEPEVEDTAGVLETHAMDPVRVLAAASALGAKPGRIVFVACEPESVEWAEEGRIGLSDPVEAAVEQAIRTVRSLIEEAFV